MARDFVPDPSTITSDFPATIFEPWPLLDRATDHAPIVEPFVIPGAESDYTVRLDHAIIEQLTTTILDITAADGFFPVRWKDNPGPGEVAIHYDRGLLRFYPTREGHGGTCGYTPLGSVMDAQWQATVQAQLVAAQAANLLERFTIPVFGVPSESTIVAYIFINQRGRLTRTIKRIDAFAADISLLAGSGSTLFYFDTAGTPSVSLPVVGTEGQKGFASWSGDEVLDVSGGGIYLPLYCNLAAGHGNITIQIEVE